MQKEVKIKFGVDLYVYRQCSARRTRPFVRFKKAAICEDGGERSALLTP